VAGAARALAADRGGGGRGGAIGYTLLTGSQIPTVRSYVASLLVVAAIMMGRETVTLRLVAAGALAVLVIAPEALMGPSFQLSSAAVTAIIALHEHPTIKSWFMARDEGRGRKVLRELG
jgi:competence protein ComEC